MPGGLEALQHSRRTIRRGVGTIVTGGLEAPVGPYALACQMDTGLLSKERDPPTPSALRSARKRLRARRGRAVLLVESTERAKERGVANIYGEIAGYGATNDAYHHSRPAPDGVQFARAMRIALEDAGIEPGDVDVIFADASGVP